MKSFLFCVLALLFVLNAYATRPMDQIEHIVIFMQENRAFDHYYGTMQGVRGFNDRAATPVPSGMTTFYQPVNKSNLKQYMLPFHVDTLTTNAICMDAPTMDFPTDISMLDNGLYDAWNTARVPGMGMSFFNRSDLAYYYTLYDNFACGDQYFMSTYTATDPNRLHVFSGSNGLSAGSKMADSPCVDDTEPVPGWDWITMGEVLEAANISWKVYQQADNFDDNGFAWFRTFQNATAGNPLYDKGLARSVDMIQDLENDLAAGKLPQVSWLVGPANVSEHASYHPSAGEDFSARILARIQAHPEVYAKMAFILNYDEGGQFYDHHWTPNVPLNPPQDGQSTVTTQGEVWEGGPYGAKVPIGPGFRVPLLVVSPWSRGNIVVSEFFDHTSVLQFVEERFNVSLPTISPWRRVVTGNLLSAFDFDHPDYSWPNLPNTSKYPNRSNKECNDLPPPQVPAKQSFPQQETGVRISRALPYEFQVSDEVANNVLTITIAVTGPKGAAFIMYDALDLVGVIPRKYTIESGKSITDTFTVPASSTYSFALHGPNGFVRQFAGTGSGSEGIAATVTYGTSNESIGFKLKNVQNVDVPLHVYDNAYGLGGPWALPLTSGSTRHEWWNIKSSGRWYDFTVKGGEGFQRRYMGRMENGKDSSSDPAMARGHPAVGEGIMALPGLDRVVSRSPDWQDHPLLPDSARTFKRKEGVSKDSKYHPDREERGEL
jgi:phospholipase C